MNRAGSIAISPARNAAAKIVLSAIGVGSRRPIRRRLISRLCINLLLRLVELVKALLNDSGLLKPILIFDGCGNLFNIFRQLATAFFLRRLKYPAPGPILNVGPHSSGHFRFFCLGHSSFFFLNLTKPCKFVLKFKLFYLKLKSLSLAGRLKTCLPFSLFNVTNMLNSAAYCSGWDKDSKQYLQSHTPHYSRQGDFVNA